MNATEAMRHLESGDAEQRGTAARLRAVGRSDLAADALRERWSVRDVNHAMTEGRRPQAQGKAARRPRPRQPTEAERAHRAAITRAAWISEQLDAETARRALQEEWPDEDVKAVARGALVRPSVSAFWQEVRKRRREQEPTP